MPDFFAVPLPVNIAILLACAAVVWFAGTRLARYADGIAQRTGMGHALAGFLFLGGVTSLPELSSAMTASYEGYGTLALSGLLGSVCINVLLLAFADAILGRDALTSVVAHPATLMQGVLGILLLSVVVFAIGYGEFAFFGIGVWSATLVPLFVLAVWLSSRIENRPTWVAADHVHLFVAPQPREEVRKEPIGGPSLGRLIWLSAAAGVAILIAGALLAEVGAAVAAETGLGTGLVGFVFIGFTTSLPEISSMIGAARLKRYELAIGDIFGTNLFDLLLIPMADLVFQGPLLSAAGDFEMLAATLGIVLTSIYVIGLINRRNRTIFRIGLDSALVVVIYAGGLLLLNAIRPL